MQVHLYVRTVALGLGGMMPPDGCFTGVKEEMHSHGHPLDIPSPLLYGFSGCMNQSIGDHHVDQQKAASSETRNAGCQFSGKPDRGICGKHPDVYRGGVCQQKALELCAALLDRRAIYALCLYLCTCDDDIV
jgi:hypothetical protein